MVGLSQWVQNRTLVVVTHRPQVLQLVDRVIVVDNGKVVMDGPKDAVLKRLAQPQQQEEATVKIEHHSDDTENK